MTASRLSIYNDALLLLGERALSSLTENREPRYLLDQVWNNDGVNHCLEMGQWKFAMRTIQIDYDTSIDPGFGYQHAFEKPSDWILTSAVCTDEYFAQPLLRYSDEAGYWYADETELYVRYVSNDSSYGNSLARWPRSFTEFVAAHFAAKVARKITGSEETMLKMIKLRDQILLEAKGRDAMADPPKFRPPGSWTRARQRGAADNDGGNRGSLIG